MKRHEVASSSRIAITERLINEGPCSNVLEIGSGDFSFQKPNTNASWTTIDFSPPCDVIYDFGKQHARLPFEDQSFDLVICTQVFEHMLWPQNLAREIYRLLKPRDGRLISSVPNVSSLTYRIAWVLGRIPSCAASGNLPPEMGSTTYQLENGDLVGGHVVDFNQLRYEKMLKLAGFASQKMYGSGIFWHRQIMPSWLLPPSLSSNLINVALRN